jgi:hypothetical protein
MFKECPMLSGKYTSHKKIIFLCGFFGFVYHYQEDVPFAFPTVQTKMEKLWLFLGLYSKIPWYPKLLFQRENALASFWVQRVVSW